MFFSIRENLENIFNNEVIIIITHLIQCVIYISVSYDKYVKIVDS